MTILTINYGEIGCISSKKIQILYDKLSVTIRKNCPETILYHGVEFISKIFNVEVIPAKGCLVLNFYQQCVQCTHCYF